MPELSENGLNNKKEWKVLGYNLPEYNIEAMKEATLKEPVWIHFGAGNLFRAFQANAVQKLLNKGVMDRGLIVAEGFDYEIVEKINRPHNELSILVTLKADGTVEKHVVASVAKSFVLDSDNEEEFNRLRELFVKKSLSMASFTITEKGYGLFDGNGDMIAAVAADLADGPMKPRSYMGKVAALLYARFVAGATPVAMVSMDNCSHNGDRLREAIGTFAHGWANRGLVDEGFVEYVNDRKKVSFPWTMIDKITPRPDDLVVKMLKEDGVADMEPMVTAKNTYVAPFVNAEECEYLVIEDVFPNGRPDLAAAGIMLADRSTVEMSEKMKVCTCLNPLHTALAVFGCLLGYKKISDEMKDEELCNLARIIGYKEGLPVVVNPEIIDPQEFIDAVINVRLPNTFMPDTPQRIATDTSKKLAIRYGETIKAYMESETLDSSKLVGIPMVLAGWLRYLQGVDDEGVHFEVSPDPGLWGVELPVKLDNVAIWGVNLYEAGLADKVKMYFDEMNKGPGAVRATLKKYIYS